MIFSHRSTRIVFSILIGLGMALGLLQAPMSAQTPLPVTLSNPTASVSTTLTHTVFLPLVARWWNQPIASAGVQFYTALNNNTGLRYAAEARARWIRFPIAWSAVEPINTTPPNYNWSGIDSSVSNAIANEINLIMTISGQPAWAAVYPMGPVTNTADLQEFMGALVERYDGDGVDDAPGSPRVYYFELYNEPDNTAVTAAQHGGWGYWGNNGAGYAQLLQAVYPVVKAASPQAQLVVGGVAMDWFTTEGGLFDPHFLEDVLAACQGHACFDVMNFHYYPPFRSRWEQYGADIIGKATYIRQVMAQYGFGNKSLICTETGWAGGTEWGNDELQSRYVVKGFVRGIAADLPIIIWYTASDGNDPTLPGLLTAHLEPKLSYYAFRNLVMQLGGAAYLRPLAPDEAGSSALVGYVFNKSGRRVDVVWTEDSTPYNPNDDPRVLITVSAAALRVVDKYGSVQFFNDADDGVADGRISLYVDGSPLYLEYNP